jgi:hypothetical protein
MTIPRPAVDRFFEKVAAGPSNCIIWTGAVDPKTGYGQFSLDKGTTTTAHRAAFRLVVGKVPCGLQLDHRCHTDDWTCPGGPINCIHRRCVNHLHLEPVTPLVNNMRSERIVSTLNALKTYCCNGHPYTDENTMRSFGPNGRPRRRCRACRSASDRGLLLPAPTEQPA